MGGILEEAPECMSEFSTEIAVFHRKCLRQTRALIERSRNLPGNRRERLFPFLEYSVRLECCGFSCVVVFSTDEFATFNRSISS